ncbi:MAG: hypothetical protein M1309_04390 [Actinobacteria bacterium]|nr:hypothetical protein [Actinomycetota bacterium]
MDEGLIGKRIKATAGKLPVVRLARIVLFTFLLAFISARIFVYLTLIHRPPGPDRFCAFDPPLRTAPLAAHLHPARIRDHVLLSDLFFQDLSRPPATEVAVSPKQFYRRLIISSPALPAYADQLLGAVRIGMPVDCAR